MYIRSCKGHRPPSLTEEIPMNDMMHRPEVSFPLRAIGKGEYEGTKVINGTKVVMNADKSMWAENTWSLHVWTVKADEDGYERYTLIHKSTEWSLKDCRMQAKMIATYEI
ncbi:hypothetical protein SEA_REDWATTLEHOG_201 [Gordonia phage RedWattleHog]|uniref:Uncharacterized protein n=1 Tax=Gordonia phage Stormageddon TaxID=2656541 RepID=A0A649VT15_9CAUD|nr:hypothetical protein KHQ86_gp098 [Gordonia phage Stormageddon]QGJ95062.1 hypothetical protein SEA_STORMAGEDDON_202 [Gordonia phage Stormageddon]QLF83704.1 hypothetical protein SEA_REDWATTLEHOG_201 [Gordonia phage RedWattleHog]